MTTLYLPYKVLELSGRLLDRRKLFPVSSAKILLKISQGREREEDWFQFYAVQATAWGSLFIISLALFATVSIIARAIFPESNWWEYTTPVFGSIPPGLLAFFFVIQAHGVCLGRVIPSNRFAVRIVHYFQEPRAINLLIVPAGWLVCFIILGFSIGLL